VGASADLLSGNLAARCRYAVCTSLPGAKISQSESPDHRRVRPSVNTHSHTCKLLFFSKTELLRGGSVGRV
jgi:hypothetical protein